MPAPHCLENEKKKQKAWESFPKHRLRVKCCLVAVAVKIRAEVAVSWFEFCYFQDWLSGSLSPWQHHCTSTRSHNALHCTATPHLTGALSLSLLGACTIGPPPPVFSSPPPLTGEPPSPPSRSPVNSVTSFRPLVSRRVDAEFLDMHKPELNPTWLPSSLPKHTFWTMEMKIKGETGTRLLPSACPSVWITLLCMCVSAAILLTTAPPAGQRGETAPFVIRWKCAVFLWMSVSFPSTSVSVCLCLSLS